jgi:hypothetical protein
LSGIITVRFEGGPVGSLRERPPADSHDVIMMNEVRR